MSVTNDDEIIRLAILDAMVADLRAGRLAERQVYHRRFVGHESSVNEEYRRLVAETDASDRLITSPSAESPAALGPGNSFGHYSELREIGQGGQGIVYHAQDDRLNRPVALKLLLGMSALRGEKLAVLL